jgi:hypothetical protein
LADSETRHFPNICDPQISCYCDMKGPALCSKY